MASTYATRTFGTPTSAYKFTISFWVKRSKLGVSHIAPITAGTYNSTNMGQFLFSGDDSLLCQTYNASGSVTMAQDTNMKFRDTNGWYHIVLGVDGTLGTAGDRQKLYVNGELITSLATDTNASQNSDLGWNQNGIQCMIGNRATTSYYFDGSLSHVHFIDGTQYTASDFGETDATTGEWKIKTSPSVTYGNNGFFILKDGNSVTDQSPNTNNFTVGGGTLTKTEDCPSNVFATLNPLCNGSKTTLSNGNTVATGNHVGDSGMSTVTLPVASSGKYYWEMKIAGSHGDYPKAGIFKDWEAIAQGTMNGASGGAFQLDAYIQKGDGTLHSDDGNISITAPANDNIIMYALDAVNGKFYIGNNGTWYNSGDPTSGSTGTGSVLNLTSGNINMIATHEYNGSISNWNFGNGYFGTTAISSAGTNASNIGIFEYDVPTGYTALSTKGLNL
jgi:hypothetical protein